jgi:sigma-B regulation protein RsbU (phosphoserine phosphatase)
MPRSTLIARPVLLALAGVFAAATLLFSVLWMYYARSTPSAELGIGFRYEPETGAIRVTLAWEGGAATRAGVRAGDRITAINGRSLDRFSNYFDQVTRGQPGDAATLTLKRAGAPAPLTVQAVLDPYSSRLRPRTPMEAAALELINLYPAVFGIVGIAVLFLRVDDRNARLLAVLFAGFIAAAPLLHLEGLIPPALRGFAVSYKVALTALLPAVFYYFFAVFPVSSPLDQRLPQLKRILLLVAGAVAVWLGTWALVAGDSQPLLEFAAGVGAEWQYTIQGAILVPQPGSVGLRLSGIYFLGGFGLGLASLVANALRAASAEARRKTRVILWGTFVGLTPLFLLMSAAMSSRRPFYFYPFWVWVPTILLSFLFPLSFAYAVVKHRVLEIPVLLKRTARYFLLRGAFLLLLLAASLWLPYRLTTATPWFVEMSLAQAVPAAMFFGVAVGLIWAVGARELEKAFVERIDRAFFRSAYDARHILQDLAGRARTVRNREELAALLQQHLREALHPRNIAVYLAADDFVLRAHGHAENLPGALPADAPVLKELALQAQPWELPLDDSVSAGSVAPVDLPQLAGLRAYLEQGTPPSAGESSGALLALLARAGAECLVPLVGRDSRLDGLVVLGPRLSEEPYSAEDFRLLASVTSQAGVALENIHMAETIAAQIETERRARQEIEIAKEVQSKLFPQTRPPLRTLDYTGACIQARTVGGDYYDFLDLGGGRVALVLADVAGKGIGAALLMANLQANLRSQYAAALDDLPRLLRNVNSLFFGSTFAERFATMFFAIYDDAARSLRFINCGHNAPLLLRASGEAQWLDANATVLGLFPDWECAVTEVQLAPADTLVIYSDGVTEAASDEGHFFGNERLLEAVRAHVHLPVAAMLDAVVADVQHFSGTVQEDDLTLLIARAR